MYRQACLACDGELLTGLQPWHMICRSCGYETGRFTPNINSGATQTLIDESARELGLKELRKGNFERLLHVIESHHPPGQRLLDVGCGHGWFLDLAGSRFSALGLEPDATVALQTGVTVRRGYFPDALEAAETFDVIVFNDVIEHIPEIDATLAECRARLNPNGILLLNLPNSRGLFYRVSKLLLKLGMPSFFERLWQKDLPSPHIHYFNPANLAAVLKRHGFAIGEIGRLETLRLSGLRDRITYTGDYVTATRWLIYAATACSLPFLRMLPNDIFYVTARKPLAGEASM
jgi:2-polyprenyl-3-methyl-5-hydroxy-6-metoxy-1,4-benzoquinol methylase